MPTVVFTRNLQRHVAAPSTRIDAATVRAALECACRSDARILEYLRDDQGALRKHIVVFVNGRPISDRAAQSDPVNPQDEIYVMQALSGG